MPIESSLQFSRPRQQEAHQCLGARHVDAAAGLEVLVVEGDLRFGAHAPNLAFGARAQKC